MTIKGKSIRDKKRNSLKHWDILLNRWQKAVDDYCKIADGDAPYWYNERANVSVLAGAAWGCGWAALEEFQYEKTEIDESERKRKVKKNTWNGRCDLFLCNKTDSELVEAKFKWLSLMSNDLVSGIERVLSAATKDASSTKGDSSDRAIGVAFISLYIKSKHVNDVEQRINDAIRMFPEVDADCFSWCFPKVHRHSKQGEYENILPGIVMFAKVAK